MSDRKRPRAAAGVLIATLLAFVPIVMTGSALGEPPVFSNVPTDIITEATGPGGIAVSYTNPTATDPIDSSNLPVSCTPDSGSIFAITTTTVNCSATGSDETLYTTSFNVTVRDTTAPVISGVPADITGVEATSPGGAPVSYTNPTAADPNNVSLPVTVSCSPDSGSIFALGETTITCGATDSRGNSATPETFTVTVQDTIAPTGSLTAPAAGPVRGTITLSSDSADSGSGVASVAFQRSPHSANTWTTISTDTISPYSVSWDTTSATDGSYDLRAVTTDLTGNSFTSSLIQVTVDNTAPTGSLTAPTSGAFLRQTVVLTSKDRKSVV